MLHEFHFLRPLWLLALIPLARLLWRLRGTAGEATAWYGQVDAHLLPHVLIGQGSGRNPWPLRLLALGWLLLVLALAGPVWQRLPEPVYQAAVYRVIALDLSASMNTTDVPPARLVRARYKLLDLLKRVGEGQTAVLAYGAEPYVVSPLTFDTDTIADQVPSLESDLLPAPGERRTDAVLAMASELLDRAGAPGGEVTLITDGLDDLAAAQEAARALRAKGHRLSILGLGPAVPALEVLAQVGGGSYQMATADDSDVSVLAASAAIKRERQPSRQDLKADQWREEGPWLLLALLPLAALAFRRGWLSPLLLLFALLPPPEVNAFEWQDLWLRPDQQAARDLTNGQVGTVAEKFQRHDWRAAAHYQAGDYARALESLKGLDGPDAGYNRGNSLAKLGQWEQALAEYDRVLAQRPDDPDTRHNRDLVRQLLEQQKQKQQQGQQAEAKAGQQGQQDKGQGQQGEAGGEPGKEDLSPRSKGEEKPQQGQQGQGKESNPNDGQPQQGRPDPSAKPPTGQDERNASEGAKPKPGTPPTDSTLAGLTPEERQAFEQRLRRVEDDPAGLLRQRFLLQHLRRSGRFPMEAR